MASSFYHCTSVAVYKIGEKIYVGNYPGIDVFSWGKSGSAVPPNHGGNDGGRAGGGGGGGNGVGEGDSEFRQGGGALPGGAVDCEQGDDVGESYGNVGEHGKALPGGAENPNQQIDEVHAENNAGDNKDEEQMNHNGYEDDSHGDAPDNKEDGVDTNAVIGGLNNNKYNDGYQGWGSGGEHSDGYGPGEAEESENKSEDSNENNSNGGNKMHVDEAMNLLGISNWHEMNEQDLNRIYRIVMLNIHPDRTSYHGLSRQEQLKWLKD